MKKWILSLILLTLPFLPTVATTKIFVSCSSPKDGNEINLPIGRSVVHVPSVGIEGHTLQRLEETSSAIYLVDVLLDGEVVYSSEWNFQEETLSLPCDLKGNYGIFLSDGSKTFIGTFSID